MRNKYYFLFFLFFLFSCETKPKEGCTHFQGTALSFPYQISIGKNLSWKEKRRISRSLDTIFEEVHKTFDLQNPKSEISRFNRSKGAIFFPISTPFEEAFRLSSEIVHLSHGRFDPTVELLTQIWEKALQNQTVPSPKELQKACDALGWDRLLIQDHALQKESDEIQINLSSISKGLAIDRIIETLQKMGYLNLFVGWGNQFRSLGKRPNGADWVVQVNPGFRMGDASIAPIALRDQAIATSGDFQNKSWTLPAPLSPDLHSHRYFHIIDPASAQPLEQTRYSIAATAVIAPTCALASALATAAMVFPSRRDAENWAKEVVETYKEVSFWILSHDDRR